MKVLDSPTVTFAVVGEMESDTTGVVGGLSGLLSPPQPIKNSEKIVAVMNTVFFR